MHVIAFIQVGEQTSKQRNQTPAIFQVCMFVNIFGMHETVWPSLTVPQEACVLNGI